MNQSELQLIANQVAQFLGLTTLPRVKIKPVDRGWARPKTGNITLPEWVLGIKCRRRAYQEYYVAHEMIHFGTGLKHDLAFKRTETEVLEKLFSITIDRDRRRPWPWRPPSDYRVYATKLMDKETGEVLWKATPKLKGNHCP